MWEPEPDWLALPGGTGTSTVGVWRAAHRRPARGHQAAGRARAAATPPSCPTRRTSPTGAARPTSSRTGDRRRPPPGLRGPSTPRSRRTPRASRSPASGSRTPPSAGCSWRMALGRFAGGDLTPAPVPGAHQLRDRLARTEHDAAGGRRWPAPRSPTSPTTSGRGGRRSSTCSTALPQVPQHGDPTRANLPGPRRRGRRRHRLGHPRHRAGRRRPRLPRRLDAARSSSRCWTPTCWACPTGSPTATRSSWRPRHRRLHRAGPRRVGAGAGRREARARWSAKYRHPAVAPHLRALQRQFPQIEALLGW